MTLCVEVQITTFPPKILELPRSPGAQVLVCHGSSRGPLGCSSPHVSTHGRHICCTELRLGSTLDCLPQFPDRITTTSSYHNNTSTVPPPPLQK